MQRSKSPLHQPNAVRSLLSLLLLLALSGAVTPARAYDGRNVGHEQRQTTQQQSRQTSSDSQRKRTSLFDQLGLSEEQKQAMHEIRETNRVKAKAIRDQLQSKRQELRAQMTAPDGDKSQAVSLQKEIAGLQSQMEALRLKTWFAMKEKMTPEQLNKLKRIRQAAKMRRERMQQQNAGGGDRTSGTRSDR
ncbi:MAG: Spy/CpxP family protein refolding chaperone [Candidatus Melainabacteria bacterium]